MNLKTSCLGLLFVSSLVLTAHSSYAGKDENPKTSANATGQGNSSKSTGNPGNADKSNNSANSQKNNEQATGIAHDGNPGNTNANEHATTNDKAVAGDAHSEDKFDHYDPVAKPALPHLTGIAQQRAEAPFDGGLSVFLLAGAALGMKKVKENRKKKQETPSAF